MKHNTRLKHLLDLGAIVATEIIPLSGGDINDSFRIITEDGEDCFIKMNRSGAPKEIITTEAQGLKLMQAKGVSMIPSPVRLIQNSTDAGLVMAYYPTQETTDADWNRFFEQLAFMHQISEEQFGGSDNFIGELPQSNEHRNNWVPFYSNNRLLPQLTLAHSNGYLSDSDRNEGEVLMDRLANWMPVERPALIHGDLWNGNILPTSQGILLIDPCPHFGHREMDFAMMSLFSGFPVKKHLRTYENIYPLEDGLFDRIELYQLYYLLVHLNLFGTAYLPGVQRIIRKFSGER